MPNRITASGITIRSLEEIKDLIINGDNDVPGLQEIYGQDAIFETDSPDGQLVGIFAQAIRDLEELALQVYSSFDPDQAVGRSLDNRVLYNAIRRKGATYTIIPVTVTCGPQATTLYGIDEVGEDGDDLFVVSDNLGNEFYLLNSYQLAPNQVATLSFRAKTLGKVEVATNSVTRMVNYNTNIIKVVNSSNALVVGENEETDEELRIRRAKAVGIGLYGSVEVLENALRQLEDVTDARVFENKDDVADTSAKAGGNFPAHSIWTIVEGGNNEKIGAVLFLKDNLGCGAKQLSSADNGVSVDVENVQGGYDTMYFCRPKYEPLLLRITATPKNSRAYLNQDGFKEELVKNTKFYIYSPVSTTDIDCTARVIQDDMSYYDIDVMRRADAEQLVTTQDIVYGDWTSITDGVLKVNINDGLSSHTFTGLNFSGVNNVAGVVNVINTAISGYGTATKVNNTIQFKSATSGTDDHYQSFLPVADDSNSGTDIYTLLGSLKTTWSMQEGDWQELMFPETYQHKFTLSKDSIILTSLSWSD